MCTVNSGSSEKTVTEKTQKRSKLFLKMRSQRFQWCNLLIGAFKMRTWQEKYISLDQLFPFVVAYIDRSTEHYKKESITRVQMLCRVTDTDVTEDMRHLVWSV